MIALSRSNRWQTLDNFSDMSNGKCDFLIFFLTNPSDHIPFELCLIFLLPY